MTSPPLVENLGLERGNIQENPKLTGASIEAVVNLIQELKMIQDGLGLYRTHVSEFMVSISIISYAVVGHQSKGVSKSSVSRAALQFSRGGY